MLKRTCVTLAAAALGALGLSSSSHADHRYFFTFYANVLSIEGTAPANVEIGTTAYIYYFLNVETPDSEPSPQIGVYPTSISQAHFAFSAGESYDFLPLAPITVIDDSARGDVYRIAFPQSSDKPGVMIELIDAESGAFASDTNPSSLDIALYAGQFDSAQLVIEGASGFPAPPDATYRIVATIDRVLIDPVFCRCDWNRDDTVNSQDYFDFLIDFFAGGGDFIPDGVHNTSDFFEFLLCFFSPSEHYNCE